MNQSFKRKFMTKIAVVYHSGSGHTSKQAEAIAEGSDGVLINIDQDGNITDQEWTILEQADAIIFGSPTYMGTVSWQFKRFADTSSKVWFTQGWKDKIFGGFKSFLNLKE